MSKLYQIKQLRMKHFHCIYNNVIITTNLHTYDYYILPQKSILRYLSINYCLRGRY